MLKAEAQWNSQGQGEHWPPDRGQVHRVEAKAHIMKPKQKFWPWG